MEQRKFKEFISFTFGDVGENHVRMQKIGKMSERGFSEEDLLEAVKWFEERGIEYEMIRLNDLLEEEDRDRVENAFVLVIRDGAKHVLDDEKAADKLYDEAVSFEWDTRAKMYGRVVNKHARYNICLDDEGQEPDYENGKGRIVSWDDAPFLGKLGKNLETVIGEAGRDLKCEGNRYYNASKCGIGWHGDAERKKVFAVRLGKTASLFYRWYYMSEPISEKLEIELNHGDMYVMSEKAVGTDWKTRSIFTLRHCAGAEKFCK